MLKRLSSILLSSLLLSMAANAGMEYLGQGVRQNKTLSEFDSYKLVHHAASFQRNLSPQIARTLHFTMLAEWGYFFTKDKMVEALAQALSANMSGEEYASLTPEIERFKTTLMGLPINQGTELKFEHIPGEGLEISMMKGSDPLLVFSSEDQNFSMKIFSIWLGRAHPDANNRASLERLIADLWRNAH